jgi:8-oxo-dGTP pyrophosphatase MutT (NUDIX family)
MYPTDRFSADSVIDHSFYAGEPIFLEEALEIFDVVIFYRTDGGYPRWWTVNSSLEAFAFSLARKVSAEPPVDSSYGNDDISNIRISSWQDRWCWDPEATGLLAISPERPATYHSRKRIIEADKPAALSAALKTTLGDYASSYPGLLRSSLGSTQLILPSVRVVIHDGQGSVLLIRRRDNGQWALVGGGHELNETITETARREVREEAGIELGQLTLATILSGPGHVTKDQYGNVNQGLVFVFIAEIPRTTYPSTESSEVIDAAWFTLNKRPALSNRHEISLKRALEFAGTVSVT